MKREGFVMLDFDCLLSTILNTGRSICLSHFLLEIEQSIVPFYALHTAYL